MDLYYIDYISVSHRSWLHKAPAPVKAAVLLGLIAVVLWIESLRLYMGLLAAVLIIALSARLPARVMLLLLLYPVFFLLVIFVSVEGLTVPVALTFSLRVLTITAGVVTFFLSTSYPAIFGMLGRVLPGFLTAALFFSYRSMFVISDSIADTRTALHLRGGFDWRRPVFTLRNFGQALGHLLVHSIDTSQRMADSLEVRGFANRIYYLGDTDER